MSTEFLGQVAAPDVEISPLPDGYFLDAIGRGIKRRWLRERRRRKVGRAYDMALEIARVIPRGSDVLDVGCGNGFIAHHLSALLGTSVIGIDVAPAGEASIDYRSYDGVNIPLTDNSVDGVLLCYVLHHAQNVSALLTEIRRVLRPNGLVIIYEDIPLTLWDRFVCWTHNLQWRKQTGACTFRSESEWEGLFESFAFETVQARRLSRWRNLMHTVCRTLCILRAS
jgi:ubiquinone/menaquinone biosynthesis C-methylase UbiE